MAKNGKVAILGISAFYHDSAAALLVDGRIVAAAQEERFSRKKHDFRFPEHACAYCLKEGGLSAQELDYVVFYDKPWVKFERLLETYLSYAPRGFAGFLMAMPLWLKGKLFMGREIKKRLDYKGPVLYGEHHESHAASAFFPSPFTEAAVLAIDGVGEWATTSFAVGRGRDLQMKAEIRFPHSLGLLYSAFTYFTGFKVNSGEYKVMGLAPYGRPVYVDTILNELMALQPDGSFRLNMKRFSYARGLTMTDGSFDKLFGGPPRRSEGKLTQREMDLARSVQVVTEMAMLNMARWARERSGCENLCLAGGVALNCVGNGKLLREGPFKNVWIQPAAGDAGGALGCALAVWHTYLKNDRVLPDDGDDLMRGAYLGPEFGPDEVKRYLDSIGAPYEEIPPDQATEQVADLIVNGKVVGWFHGRMEFGPRALGGRSIIGDARSPEMQKKMNLKIKYRESFRPFAPSCLAERISDIFEIDRESPYMLLVADVREKRRIKLSQEQEKLWGIDLLNIPKSDVPAITHVDYSARIQSVNGKWNKPYHEIIRAVERKTGIGCIVNTSFNVRGEPIVCTPQDAYRCFMRTEMDYLVFDNIVLDKTRQKPLEQDSDWRKEFELD